MYLIYVFHSQEETSDSRDCEVVKIDSHLNERNHRAMSINVSYEQRFRRLLKHTHAKGLTKILIFLI